MAPPCTECITKTRGHAAAENAQKVHHSEAARGSSPPHARWRRTARQAACRRIRRCQKGRAPQRRKWRHACASPGEAAARRSQRIEARSGALPE